MEKRLVIELAANGVLSLSDTPGTRLECLEGAVWLTEDGARTDIVLERGRSHPIGRKGRTVVQALGAARIAVHAPSARPQLAFGAEPLAA